MAFDPAFLAAPGTFAFLAVAFQLVGLLMRRELWLRILILIGTAFYVAYYMTAGSAPLWEAILGSALLAAANISAMSFLVLDRTTFRMPPEDRALLKRIGRLTPGQFRRIMRLAERRDAAPGDVFCHQGEEPPELIFILEGSTHLTRDGRTSLVPAGHFVGEMSFLQGPGHPATATVAAGADCRYVAWPRTPLHAHMERAPALANALLAALGDDLVRKLDRSWPLAPPAKD